MDNIHPPISAFEALSSAKVGNDEYVRIDGLTRTMHGNPVCGTFSYPYGCKQQAMLDLESSQTCTRIAIFRMDGSSPVRVREIYGTDAPKAEPVVMHPGLVPEPAPHRPVIETRLANGTPVEVVRVLETEGQVPGESYTGMLLRQADAVLNANLSKDQLNKKDAGKVLAGTTLERFPRAIRALAEVSTFGITKKDYSRPKWAEVERVRYWDAFNRHMLDHLCGERCAADSGLPHLHHALWNLIAIVEKDLRENPNQ